MMYVGWLMASVIFFCLGGYAWTAKSPVKFWNIAQHIKVCDIKKYNQAVGKLWFMSAVVFDAIGLPLLKGQNSAWIVVTILGTMAWAIAVMVIYTGIEKKYRIS